MENFTAGTDKSELYTAVYDQTINMIAVNIIDYSTGSLITGLWL